MNELFRADELRQATLAAWASSPTRFREDANAEDDLRYGGYRDRLFVELAQNAADAAGAGGILRATVAEGELRVANTGAPLDAEGVAALASLRASAKRSGGVGQFGVGFAAVLAVSTEPSVRSAAGGVRFSAADTLTAVQALPELAAELADRDNAVPVLRLPWPVDPAPLPPGFDTEVCLPLSDVDGQALLDQLAGQAEDLLLALPGLSRIEVADQVWTRTDHPDGTTELHTPDGPKRWALHRESGQLGEEVLLGLGVEARRRTGWTVCWAVRLDESGQPRPAGSDVLYAPTPTDERLSLPARLFAGLPIEPSRRRLAPSPAADAVLRAAAACYPRLLLALPPTSRTALVPLPEFPLSEVDEKLRELVLTALSNAEWLVGAEEDTVLSPRQACLLDVAAPELVELLGPSLGGLLPAELAEAGHLRALQAVGVRRIRLPEVVATVAGVDRAPEWWHRLYTALAPVAEVDSTAREELGALPVPLVDGRTVTGPRGVLLPEVAADILTAMSTVDIGLRVVHPDAAHRLLERLGARQVGAAELLDELRPAVERSVEDLEAGLDTTALTEVVLRLVDLAGLRRGEAPWLSALALPDEHGDPRRADELLLPGSPLRAVLGEDSPLGVVAADVAERWSPSLLTAIGVLDSFPIIVDENPAGPEHDLPDEQEWWDELAAAHPAGEGPRQIIAVGDLDLVAEEHWPAALRLLAADPLAWQALRLRDGHTAWWLSRFALIGGRPPRDWRRADVDELNGLYEVVPAEGLSDELLALLGVRDSVEVSDVDDAIDVLARLADPDRLVREGVVLRAHEALADAVSEGRVDPAEVDPPAAVRSLAGTVVATERALVLDGPWWLAVLDPAEVVAGGEASPLADLLDLPTSDGDEVVSDSQVQPWAELDGVVESCDLLGLDYPDGDLHVHQELVVLVDEVRHTVPWWLDPDGDLHTTEEPQGLARALAWTLDRWEDRHLLAALLADPTAPTLLR
ncbi:sacsin N-terminal ATP-binding-like domain-containing protein [Crossiella sp. CA198]|uniref:sacsin N-terminal ATP-binding-like domain-containing protein n=1 Tax=Crossiella sp. CA198 TaxID=3455607 RepID=UPI003F8D60D5